MGGLLLTVEGVDQFADMLRDLGEVVGSKAIRDGSMRGGALIAAEWQAIVPVASGRLQRSIHHEEVSADSARQADIASGVGFAGVIVGPDRDAWYGHFTEGGTRPHELNDKGGFHPGIPGQHTGQRVLDENADTVVGFIGDEIKQAVDARSARAA
jgi:HK97 gp10 family phage protein